MSNHRPLPHDDLQRVLGHVGAAWSSLSGAAVLLTGASGLFGSWMLESVLHADDLLGLGVEILAPTRSRERFERQLPHLAGDPRLRLIPHDICTMPAPAGSIDCIIHSLVPSAGTSLAEMEAFFTAATARLLDLASEKRASSFLLCSTGAVYRPKSGPGGFSELDELLPADGPLSYGLIRRQVEDRCLEGCARSGVALKIARGFSFAGPRLPLDAGFAFGNFLRDAMAGGPVIVKGDGTPVRSYMHMADLTSWLWKILLEKQTPAIVNVGSEESISIGGLAQSIGCLFGVPVRVERGSMPGAAPSWYVPSTRLARESLGLPAGLTLEETIAKSARWESGS